MIQEDIRTIATFTGVVLALCIAAAAIISALTGSWQPLVGSLTGAAIATPTVAAWPLPLWLLTKRSNKARNRKDHQ